MMTPRSVNATSMENATFECMVQEVDSVGWYVDNEYIRGQHNMERSITFLNKWDDGIFHSILTIRAIPVNDGSKIECATFIFGEGERRTSPVYLNIQGRTILLQCLLLLYCPPKFYGKYLSLYNCYK